MSYDRIKNLSPASILFVILGTALVVSGTYAYFELATVTGVGIEERPLQDIKERTSYGRHGPRITCIFIFPDDPPLRVEVHGECPSYSLGAPYQIKTCHMELFGFRWREHRMKGIGNDSCR